MGQLKYFLIKKRNRNFLIHLNCTIMDLIYIFIYGLHLPNVAMIVRVLFREKNWTYRRRKTKYFQLQFENRGGDTRIHELKMFAIA